MTKPTSTPTPPTSPVQLPNNLTLTPRIKLILTIHPTNPSIITPSSIDDWKLKRSLIDFLKTSFSLPITVPEEDLTIRRSRDLKKRKRSDPVATCELLIRDLGFVSESLKKYRSAVEEEDDVEVVLERKFLEWRKVVVEKMDGMEVNLEGAKFKVSVVVPVSDDWEELRKDWEEFFAFRARNSRGYSKGAKQEPDTIILRGLPSRWFAEPRVSSKPSMLVTHTIFSTFGKIRNLNVAEDSDVGKDANEDDADLVSGLHCKVVVQYENYNEFYKALKVLCSRSLQKEGSRMKADYEVAWDKDGFFQSARQNERGVRTLGVGAGYRNESRRRSTDNDRYSPDDVRPKRFRE